MNTYIDSLGGELPPALAALEQEALATDVPIIRKDTQRFMRFLLTMQKPHSIVEVGCAVGFSALLMREYTPADTKITTMEKFEKRIPIARANFERLDPDHRITLLTGDAEDILKTLPDASADFLFMDAAKGQYITFLPEVKRILAPGGLLMSDNVLQDGDVLESRFAVERRNRTIYTRMREYLQALTHDPDFETVILTSGDGTALSYKK